MPQKIHRDAVIRTVGDAYMEVYPAPVTQSPAYQGLSNACHKKSTAML